MRWRGRRQSDNIEDRRGSPTPSFGGAGRGGILNLLPMVFKLFGVKGVVLAVLAIGAYGLFAGNLGTMLGGGPQSGVTHREAGPAEQRPEERELVDFTAVVLAETEETWNKLFRETGETYQEPRLVLFRGAVDSACGLGQAAMGPFYCPGDEKIYLDLSFFSDLHHRFGAPGDFAQAYVIAHEVGHHVQTVLGVSKQVREARQAATKVEANRLSVRQELQADCLAGVWAHHAGRSRQLLEPGDIEEGLAAASAIGDDRLQKRSQGYVSPDSFTHGSSAQRVKWFKAGLRQGTLNACDTLSAKEL